MHQQQVILQLLKQIIIKMIIQSHGQLLLTLIMGLVTVALVHLPELELVGLVVGPFQLRLQFMQFLLVKI